MSKTRGIRFRAWDKTTQQMTGDFDCLSPRMAMFIAQYSSDPKDYALMQYTGLKDKSGKEIYEGDIVTWPNDDFSPENGRDPLKLGEVVYEHSYFLFLPPLDMPSDPCDYPMSEVEVIGNIYENPELISGEDDEHN